MSTKSKDSVLQLDTKVLFKVSRQDDGLLTVRFFDTFGFPLTQQENILEKYIDNVVQDFRPDDEKMQILIYPNEKWFQKGCPHTRFTRKFNGI